MTESIYKPQLQYVKTPSFLLLATLLFWGWESGLFVFGAVMGVILESSRIVKARWELSDAEFRRILMFCTLLALATALYAFSVNEQAHGLGDLFSGPAALRNVSMTTMQASFSFFRWLPMTLFLFVAAQTFSTREKLPWAAISYLMQRRLQKERKSDNRDWRTVGLNVPYAYFIVCLFSAGIHPNDNSISYFLGQCVLIFWGLWPFRSRRVNNLIWVCTLAGIIVFGFIGQKGFGLMERFIEGQNVQWMSRFLRQPADPMKSSTSIGQIGRQELSGQIVIRLWTEYDESPPTYLREASYRVYNSTRRSWYSGSTRSEFENILPETNQLTWVLLPKTNNAEVNIACYLSGGKALLPLPEGCGQLENLNAYILQKNSEGAVLVEGPGLVIFDALYGSGASIDSVPDTSTNLLDLRVPTNEVPALDEVISQMNFAGKDESQTLDSVYDFFQTNFTYSTWQGPDKLATTNGTPLSRFLLTSRSGHCEYFATATVLLLRELKIPARYAVGYFVHEKSGHGYLVRERDAHAWCIVWNKKTRIWEDFDTTPPSWVDAESKRASVFQWLSDFRSWIGFQISKFIWGQTHLREYILWGLVPVLAVLLYQIIFRRGRQKRQNKSEKKSEAYTFWPGLDSEFYLLERKLGERSVPRLPGEPLAGWLERALEEPALKDLHEPLRELLKLHYRHRFDPTGLTPEEREKLRRESKACLDRFSEKAGR